MNPETPQGPREELEARLTALLLGELPEPEAAALRERIAGERELQQLHDRLKLVHDLMQEMGTAAGGPVGENQPAPLTLPAAKRKALLKHFKKPVPKPAAVIPVSFWQANRREWLQLAAMLVGLCAITVLMVPGFLSSPSAKARRAMVGFEELASLAPTAASVDSAFELGDYTPQTPAAPVANLFDYSFGNITTSRLTRLSEAESLDRPAVAATTREAQIADKRSSLAALPQASVEERLGEQPVNRSAGQSADSTRQYFASGGMGGGGGGFDRGGPAEPTASSDENGAAVGRYFNGLTRDDVGGLRFSFRDNTTVDAKRQPAVPFGVSGMEVAASGVPASGSGAKTSGAQMNEAALGVEPGFGLQPEVAAKELSDLSKGVDTAGKSDRLETWRRALEEYKPTAADAAASGPRIARLNGSTGSVTVTTVEPADPLAVGKEVADNLSNSRLQGAQQNNAWAFQADTTPSPAPAPVELKMALRNTGAAFDNQPASPPPPPATPANPETRTRSLAILPSIIADPVGGAPAQSFGGASRNTVDFDSEQLRKSGEKMDGYAALDAIAQNGQVGGRQLLERAEALQAEMPQLRFKQEAVKAAPTPVEHNLGDIALQTPASAEAGKKLQELEEQTVAEKRKSGQLGQLAAGVTFEHATADGTARQAIREGDSRTMDSEDLQRRTLGRAGEVKKLEQLKQLGSQVKAGEVAAGTLATRLEAEVGQSSAPVSRFARGATIALPESQVGGGGQAESGSATRGSRREEARELESAIRNPQSAMDQGLVTSAATLEAKEATKALPDPDGKEVSGVEVLQRSVEFYRRNLEGKGANPPLEDLEQLAKSRIIREVPKAPAGKRYRYDAVSGKVSLEDLDEAGKPAHLTAEPPAPSKPATPPPVPQPEVSTAQNAFSTFSLNVSDVSFKLAAASLEKGVLPEAASIRTEEFINAFNYHDPEPTGAAPIAFAWERARYPFAHDRDLIRFSVKTAASGRLNGRPLNLVLLLDNSGSMERADRVAIREQCLRVLAGQLQAQDRISVVSFARTARLWMDGQPGNQAGELPQRVGSLTPEGGTNLEDALNLAYQTAQRHFLPHGVNRVVLLTDGAANLGDVEPESLKKKVEANRKQGVAFDCFGIGWEGYNDDLLETLSRNGDGRYGFVNTPLAAATDFAGQLAGALKVAASDVKVQVEWNPRRVTTYRQIGYAKHQLKKEQFRDNTVDAAEIAAAEAGNALYTVQVNPRGEGSLGVVRVRFRVPNTSDYREHEWPLAYAGAAKALEDSSLAMRLAATSSAFSEMLAGSPFAGEVTPDALLGYLAGVPEQYPADPRPKQLEWMLRQAKSLGVR